MLKKFTNKKGFTLMEMLIVVAIIAVLIAIAIPTFSSALNKSKAATDLANIRSGYAAAQLEAMTKTHTADTKYWLKSDGSVAGGNTAPTDAYKTKGSSANADTSASVGGQFTVAGTTSSTGKVVAWENNKTICYTVSTGGEVTAITAN